MITKEQVWKGLRLESSDKEIRDIFQSDDFEEDNYYDFDMLMNVLHKALNKKINFKLFIDWCILVANSYNCTKEDYKSKLGKLYCDVGYMFDAVSFMDEYDRKGLLSTIANLKYYNHLIIQAENSKNEPFLTNNIERILVFDHSNCNFDSSVYRAIIKDYKHKKWEIRYVDDCLFEFDESKNYSFVDDKEFEKIFYEFYNENSDWKEVHSFKF